MSSSASPTTPPSPPQPASNPLVLLGTRRFLPMFLTQLTGVLNDNVFKQALIVLFTFHAALFLSQGDVDVALLNNLAAGLFILPFFLFSAIAGQLADKYDKARLCRYLKLAEIAIMLVAVVGFFTHSLWLLLLALFGMGVHSAFFGPIKYGILPQLLDRRELVAGNSLFETGTSMGILIGMIAGIAIIRASSTAGHVEMLGISVTVVSLAFIGWLAARQIPAQAGTNPDLPVSYNPFTTTWRNLKAAYQLPVVFWAILGISWFWYYGATFIAQLPQFAKDYLKGDESLVSLLLTLFSIGVAVGSLAYERLAHGKVNLKIVLLAALGLGAMGLDLYWATHLLADAPTAQAAASVSWLMALQQPHYWHLLASLVLIGVMGGLYSVPLYTLLQTAAPEASRSRMIAANNILNALFMVVSALLAIVWLVVLKLHLPTLLMITAVVGAVLSLWIVARLKKHTAEVVQLDSVTR